VPTYCYACKKCKLNFEVRHSMSYEDQKCIFCESKEIFKIPSLLEKKPKIKSSKPGKVVEEYIEDTKKQIKKEKNNMKLETI
jgi:hypothetical protein